MKTAFRVENLREAPGGAICFADLTLQLQKPDGTVVDLVTIHECELRDGEKSRFIGPPRGSWTGRDGSRHWVKHITFPKHTYRAALAALEAAWDAHTPQPQPETGEPDSDPFG